MGRDAWSVRVLLSETLIQTVTKWKGVAVRLVGYRTAESWGIGRRDGESKLVPLGSMEQFWVDPARGDPGVDGERPRRRRLTLVPPRSGRRAHLVRGGLNYPAHVEEKVRFNARRTRPSSAAGLRSLTVSGTPAPVPNGEQGLDWEGELVAVVGREIKNASATRKQPTLSSDTQHSTISPPGQPNTARPQWTRQRERRLQSGPMSEIVTTDEAGDPRAGLRIVTRVNGEIMQDGNTSDMIFGVE